MKLTVFCFALALGAGAVFGQGRTLWQDGGVRLCGSSASTPMTATSDSAGGAIVVWTDTRDSPYGTYAQRVDAAGVPLWAEDGVLVSDSTGRGSLGVVTDEEHGAIVVWGPSPSAGASISVQRVSAAGAPLWGSNGLVLRPWVSNPLVDNMPAVVRDGHGGAIVVWNAYPMDGPPDTLIASRLDSSGTKLWETVVRIDTINDPPFLCEDGHGGVIIAWSEDYLGPVRAQRVDSAGAIKWDSAGVLACTLSTVKSARACVAAGESSFAVGFAVGPGDSWHNRAQMFDFAGDRQWGAAGVPVAGTSYSSMGGLGLSADGRRQSIWLWCESRAGTYDFFAQMLDSTGTRRWDTTNAFFGSTDTSPWGFSAGVDGRGGAIAAWPLHRDGLNWDIHAQHIDSTGHLCWSDTGLAVCRDTNRQQWTPAVTPDGDGGAIIAWLTYQSGVGGSIYAQRVADGAGIAESRKSHATSHTLEATVVRGVLVFGAVDSRQNTAYRAELLDAGGRKMMGLRAGANDVRMLPPGVYVIEAGPGLRAKVVKLN